MGKRKRTTKQIPPRKPLPVPVEDKHPNSNDTDKSNKVNTPAKCLVCSRINSNVATPFDDVSTFQILCQLFKILKISPAVCRFLLADSLSTENMQFCESCDKTITHCLKVSQEIDNLRKVLEDSTIKIKEDIIEGYYCRPDPDPDSSQRTNSKFRKTLVQCWTTCQVTLKKLPPSSFEIYPSVKTTKRSKPALWSVKQEVCDDNKVDFTEGPNSHSQNEIVEPHTQKEDVVETECDTADHDFDSDDIESPRFPIASCLISNGSDPEKIDDPDPGKKYVVSKSPCFPFPSPLLGIDQKVSKKIGDNPSKIDTSSDVKNEQEISLTSQRTLRPRPKNKILTDIEIESDENASDTGSVYSPKSPFNDEEQEIHEARTTKEHHVRSPSSSSPLKFRKRHIKMKPRGKSSTKPKTGRSTASIRKQITAQSPFPSLNKNCQEFPFSCKNCNRGFTLRQMLENHNCPHDFDDSKFPCNICNKVSFSTLPTLRKHQIIKHNGRKSKTLQKLENKSKKLESFLCTYCNKNYERRNFRVIPDTETEAEGGQLSIHCDLPNCEKTFSNFYRFSIHHSRTCIEKARLIAENPENNRGLQGYVRTYADSKVTNNDTTETLLSCKICGMNFQRKKGLYLHEMRHTGQKITCPECPENFKSIVSVRLHQVRVHGQPTKSTYDADNELDSFECVWCKESFLRSSYLVPAPEAEAKPKNPGAKDSGDPTSPPNKILRIDVHRTEATLKKTLSDFKEFQWHHRRHCPSRPMIQLGNGYMERRNKILTRKFRSPTTTTEMETAGTAAHFPFSCSICGKGYQKLIPYNAHLAFHRQEFNYPCTICKDKFVSLELLNRHISYHHGITPNSNSYHCTPCDKRIDVIFEQGTGESGESNKAPCVFDNCSSSSFNVKCHQAHHRTHHNDLKSRHYCAFCKKDFFSDKFSERTYSGDLKFKCSFTDKCDKLYDNFQSWSHHHIYHHRFLEKGLKQRQSPKKAELHFCQFCQKGFVTQSSVRAHETTAHTKNFEFYCEVCGLGRPNADKLQQHMLCHSEVRPFACDLCPSAFKTKIHLKFHMNKHNDIRPYVCEVCGKAFHSSNHLNMHRKNHKK